LAFHQDDSGSVPGSGYIFIQLCRSYPVDSQCDR
jgi:hypothetical protein